MSDIQEPTEAGKHERRVFVDRRALAPHQWHLDKRMMLTVIILLVSQIGIGARLAWMGGALVNRVEVLEVAVGNLAATNSTYARLSREQAVLGAHLDGVETQITDCKGFHKDLIDKLDRVLFKRNGARSRAHGGD